MKTDRIVSFSAIFISVLSLVIFLYQTNLMQKQASRSVLPYVSLEIETDFHLGYFTVNLVNNGIGPAIIESRKILYQGVEHDLDFVDFLSEQTSLLDTLNVRTNIIENGTALATGKKITLLQAHAGSNLGTFVTEIEQMQIEGGLDYEITYRSIYDERWRITGESDLPEEL